MYTFERKNASKIGGFFRKKWLTVDGPACEGAQAGVTTNLSYLFLGVSSYSFSRAGLTPPRQLFAIGKQNT